MERNEIERPADADVQDAIDALKKPAYTISINGDFDRIVISQDTANLAITALCQMKPVQDAEIDKLFKNEEVQKAIDDLSMGMKFWRKDLHYTPCPPSVHIAITALRAYRKPEPCEWCKRWDNWRKVPGNVPWSFDEKELPKSWPFSHCPNCERDLRGEV